MATLDVTEEARRFVRRAASNARQGILHDTHHDDDDVAYLTADDLADFARVVARACARVADRHAKGWQKHYDSLCGDGRIHSSTLTELRSKGDGAKGVATAIRRAVARKGR